MNIKAKSYKESRLEFFESKLKLADKKLLNAIRQGEGHEICCELGEKVSFYTDVVNMLKEESTCYNKQ